MTRKGFVRAHPFAPQVLIQPTWGSEQGAEGWSFPLGLAEPSMLTCAQAKPQDACSPGQVTGQQAGNPAVVAGSFMLEGDGLAQPADAGAFVPLGQVQEGLTLYGGGGLPIVLTWAGLGSFQVAY